MGRADPFRSAPYVDTPFGDLDAANRLAVRAADEWGLDRPGPPDHASMNAVYAVGEHVIRVGRPTAPATLAIELAERLLGAGLLVPRAADVDPLRDDTGGDGSGGAPGAGVLTATLWERARADGAPVDWRAVGEMVARLHAAGPTVVPAGYPCPPATAFPWWDFDELLSDPAIVGRIDGPALGGLRTAVARHRWWRQGATREIVVCHGDVHPGNIVQTAAGPVLLDWDLLCTAPAGWDHAPMMTWAERWGGAPGQYEAYAAGYGHDLRGDPFAEAAAELRLVAATLLRLRAAHHDPTALAEARRRLAYWRDDPAAPMWRAVREASA